MKTPKTDSETSIDSNKKKAAPIITSFRPRKELYRPKSTSLTLTVLKSKKWWKIRTPITIKKKLFASRNTKTF